jgi:hypothetical protein
VTSLLNKTRVAIAAQSLGIAEAAYRAAREFAHTRGRYGHTIEDIPAVRELLVDMAVDLQAARVLTYYAAFCLDLERGGASNGTVSSALKKRSALLSPMCKYYASEMSVRVANHALTVLGGSGYMRDYPVERHLRDSRITTIYEGTTQIQVVSAFRPVLKGAIGAIVTELIDRDWIGPLSTCADRIRDGLRMLDEAAACLDERRDADYTDLHSRRLIDMACVLLVGALLCGQAPDSRVKETVAGRWLDTKMPRLCAARDIICSGNRSVLDDFDALARRVP